MTIRTWAVGGEAQDDEGSARLLAHMAAGGRVGVLGPLDCRVLPLTTPGPGFRVTTGAFSNEVPTRDRQKYLGEIDAMEEVTGLQGTGSSGGRHDLVCLRTNNPNLPGGGQAPPDPIRGTYTQLEVITGVPLGTRTFEQLGFLYAAQALARIEYPASVATIGGGTGNAKIVDLRAVSTGADADSGGSTDTDAPPGTDPIATPPAAASQDFYEVHPGVYPGTNRDLTAYAWGAWPSGNAPSATFPVPVPLYARSMSFEATVENALTIGGDVYGWSALYLDGPGGGYTLAQVHRYEWAGNVSTVKVGVGGVHPISAGLRGRVVPMTFMASRLNPSPGYLRFLQGSSWLTLRIRFRA